MDVGRGWRRLRASRWSFWYLLGAVTVVAALLVWWGIGSDSFWYDEDASLRFADHTGWGHLLTVDNGNMALYLALLKAWLGFATTEAAIRLLSAIAFVATVPIVGLIGKRIGGRRVGILAAALAATQPLLVRYGQEARGYALVTLLVSIGVLGLLAGVQDRSPAKLVAGVVVLGIAPYAHAVAGLAGAALLVWTLWLPDDARPVGRAWIIGIWAVLVAPLVVVLLGAGSQQINWANGSNPATQLLNVGWHVISDTVAILIVGALLVVGLVLTYNFIRSKGRTVQSYTAGVPAVWLVGTGVFGLLVSVHQSLLVARYFLLLAPAVALLVALTATRVSWSKLAISLVVLAVVVNAGVIVARHGEYRTEHWRQAQKFVSARAQDGDTIAFDPTDKSVSFEHYQVHNDDTLPNPILPAGEWGSLPLPAGARNNDKPADVKAKADAIAQSPRIWVVTAHGVGMNPKKPFQRALQSELEMNHERTGEWHFGDVDVQLYSSAG